MRRLVLALALAVVGLPGVLRADAPPAGGGLALKVSVEPSPAVSGAPLRLVARFENTGPQSRKVFFPEHATAGAYPSWRIVRADGAVFAPMPWIGQSMWTLGVQGEVATLGRGESREFTAEVVEFAAVDARGETDWTTPRPLPPGEYEVEATYEQATAKVPVGLDDFAIEMREEPGLWTGTVRSPKVGLRVVEARVPHVTIDAPEAVEPGGPAAIVVRVSNPTDAPVRGTLFLEAHSKMYGGGGADLPEVLTVGAGKTEERTIDLSTATWTKRVGGPTGWGLYEMIPEGLFSLSASFLDPVKKETIVQSSLFREVRPRELRAPEGLRLVLDTRGGTRVAVRLEAVDGATAVLPQRLAYPDEIWFSVTYAEGRKGREHSVTMTAPTSFETLGTERLPAGAWIVEGSSWNGDAFDADRPAKKEDYARSAAAREFDLARLVAGGLPAGRYRVQAFWHNSEDGRRLGVGPVAVGRLESAPVVIEVAPR